MFDRCLFCFIILTACFLPTWVEAAVCSLSGTVIDHKTGSPLQYATVRIKDTEYAVMSDESGNFKVYKLKAGQHILMISALSYQPKELTVDLDADIDLGEIGLEEISLALDEVFVTASRNTTETTTSYILDRTTLDHSQVLNLTDIMALLPGNQTVNSTLINDSRLALRAGDSEQGNASFGTAIVVDGVRLDNNANMEETLSASTRNVSTSNIGAVEVMSGIPGAEYGDVSNGVVNVTPRKGRSPWIVEASLNPHTYQVAINKGLSLPKSGGILNISGEFARSFSKIASPYTSYRRSQLFISYSKFCDVGWGMVDFYVSVTGNLGGYMNKADPDAFLNTYTQVRDDQLRSNLKIGWENNTDNCGLFKINFQGAITYTDKLSETNTNVSSSSSQAYIHVTETGYNIARDYNNDFGTGNIILGPTGYWYVKSFNDQKPLSLQFKVRGEWNKEGHSIIRNLTLGSEYNLSRNNGHGLFYEDIKVAPTWRPYDYSSLPSLNTLAFFAEEKLLINKLTITTGIRNDNTFIKKSVYGAVSTFSPRFNIFFQAVEKEKLNLSFHAGYGQGYKLPSFQVLYPSNGYTDKLIFTPGSTYANKAYYAYYTHVNKSIPNRELHWQSAHQTDIGAEIKAGGLKFTFSVFYNYTVNPYQQINIFTPFSYNYTSQAALEECGIPSEFRVYGVDSDSGVVTVTDIRNGSHLILPTSKRNTYVTNRKFVNGTPVSRYGVEWMADLTILKVNPVGLTLRVDGNFYRYKGVNNLLIAGTPAGVGDYSEDGGIKPLLGYYDGSNITSASSISSPSVSNGSVNKGCSINTTLTIRIPKVKMIMTVRLESTFLNYKKNLASKQNAILMQSAGEIFGNKFNGKEKGYVAVYPQYYSTWDNPDERIPFAETLEWALNNDETLFRQLCNLIVRSNTDYYFIPQNISAYFSANFSITKEIGRLLSISFYANNFFNNMSFVKNAQTGLQSSLFSSGYIPKFYYGMSVRVKF